MPLTKESSWKVLHNLTLKKFRPQIKLAAILKAGQLPGIQCLYAEIENLLLRMIPVTSDKDQCSH